MKIKPNILYKIALSNSPILKPLLVLKQKLKNEKLLKHKSNVDIKHNSIRIWLQVNSFVWITQVQTSTPKLP